MTIDGYAWLFDCSSGALGDGAGTGTGTETISIYKDSFKI